MSKYSKKMILFVGTFPSRLNGTKDVCEFLASKLTLLGWHCTLTSKKENKVLRILDISWTILFFSGNIVHINVFSGRAFMIAEIAARLAKWTNKNIVLTLHGGALNKFYLTHTRRVNKTLALADLILTPSYFLQDFFKDFGINVGYLPNCIDHDKFPFRHKNSNGKKLLWVRAFSTIYNPELAIKALAIVAPRYPDIMLSMVGPDKGLKDKCIALAKQLNILEIIEFVGPIDNDRLKEFYHSHDIYLNTTSYESFGTAVVEAASCGIPIISTKVGEIPYLWSDGQEILMVNNLSELEMANQISRILENDSLANNLVKQAKKKAAKFSWDNLESDWVKLLIPLDNR